FEAMFQTFEAERGAIAAWLAEIGGVGRAQGAVARLCGLAMIEPPADLEARAMAPPQLAAEAWFYAARALSRGNEKTDEPLGRKLQTVAEAALRGETMVEAAREIFFTRDGSPRKSLGTKVVHPRALAWLVAEQERLAAAFEQARACAVAEDTLW